ncbi:MAG TPA: HEAT repeat domain-containing protein [Pirellulales bacterium]|nr:HEAT repeat domain-containing protein [Pirellulales bacterium]
MNSGDRARRSAAVAELGRLDAWLLMGLDNPGLREDALRVLINIGLEDQIPIATLGKITVDGSPTAQRRAWGVLSRKDMFGPKARAAFARFAKGPSGEAIKAVDVAVQQAELSEAVRVVPGTAPSSVTSLESLSRSDDGRVRLLASDLLADRAKAVESIPELIAILDGADPHSRELATHALEDLGPKASRAVPALARHLADESELVRLYSAYALASIGPAAREAVPALQQAAKSDDPALRSAARHALAKIELAAKPK